MKIHKKIPFTLEKYIELKDAPGFELKNKMDESVRIYETNEKYSEGGIDYPIIGLSENANHISRFTKDGDCINYGKGCYSLESRKLYIYYDEEMKSDIEDIVITYNGENYRVTYGDPRDPFHGCDACSLSKEAEYDKRLCKICSAFHDGCCGNQYLTKIKK